MIDGCSCQDRMPKILFITAHCPYGQIYGAQLRTLNLAKILKTYGEFGMVLLPFGKIGEDVLERTRKDFNLLEVFEFLSVPPRTLASRLRSEFDPYCSDTESMRLSDEDSSKFFSLVKKFDLVWFQGVAIPNCLGQRGWPQAILDIDDVPSQFFAARAREASSLIVKIRMMRKSLLWRRREKVLLKRFGILGVCSEMDRAYLGGESRIHTIPNGFSSPNTSVTRAPSDIPRIGFIGTLSYAPNVEGLQWFIREVWPLIKRLHPLARLRLIGAGTDEGIAISGCDIDGLGFVEDSAAEIATWSMTVVPILVGGGTRIKIAEAFSCRCPVVSTSLGAYGYVVTSGRELLLADTPEDFAAACSKLIQEPDHGEAMADRARALFDRELNWDAIAPRVGKAVEACLLQNAVAGT